MVIHGNRYGGWCLICCKKTGRYRRLSSFFFGSFEKQKGCLTSACIAISLVVYQAWRNKSWFKGSARFRLANHSRFPRELMNSSRLEGTIWPSTLRRFIFWGRNTMISEIPGTECPRWIRFVVQRLNSYFPPAGQVFNFGMFCVDLIPQLEFPIVQCFSPLNSNFVCLETSIGETAFSQLE